MRRAPEKISNHSHFVSRGLELCLPTLRASKPWKVRNDRKGAFAPGGSSKRGPIYELAVLRLLKERNGVAQEIVGRTFRIYRTDMLQT